MLRAQGKIIYAGSSNFAGWHIAQAQEAAQRHGAFGLLSEQSLYNLAVRAVELDGSSLVRLDEIFPGPGGAAPEAYAW